MADETKVEAVCTWGEAEDVTIVGKHSCSWKDRFKSGLIFLLADPVRKIFQDRPKTGGSLSYPVHGYAADWQFSMTMDEAEELGHSLLRAAQQARKLDSGFRDALMQCNEDHDE